MATVTLTVNADGGHSGWSSTNTTFYTEIDEGIISVETSDNVTSPNQPSGTENISFSVPDLPGDFGTPNSVQIQIHAKKNVTDNDAVSISQWRVFKVTNLAGNLTWNQGVTTSYQPYSDTDSDVSFSASDWSGSTFFIYPDSSSVAMADATRNLEIAAVDLVIDYEPDTVNYTLTADSGSFSVSGTAASLEATRVISATSGSFSFSGTAATLIYGLAVIADPGSYSISGISASLLADRILGVDSGTFAFSGTDATLVYGYMIAASPGSFAITGQDVGFIWNHNLAADSASFAVSGTAAGLLADRVLSAGAGSFQFTGQDVTFDLETTAYQLQASSGAFQVTGSDVGLFYNPAIIADSGSFVFSGTDANLEYSRILSAAGGAYTISGQDAALLAARRLMAGSGGYLWAGQDADLQLAVDYVLLASRGDFVIEGADVSFPRTFPPPPPAEWESRFLARIGWREFHRHA